MAIRLISTPSSQMSFPRAATLTAHKTKASKSPRPLHSNRGGRGLQWDQVLRARQAARSPAVTANGAASTSTLSSSLCFLMVAKTRLDISKVVPHLESHPTWRGKTPLRISTTRHDVEPVDYDGFITNVPHRQDGVPFFVGAGIADAHITFDITRSEELRLVDRAVVS